MAMVFTLVMMVGVKLPAVRVASILKSDNVLRGGDPLPDYLLKGENLLRTNIGVMLRNQDVKIHVDPKTMTSRLYKINTYPVPVSKDTADMTKIEGLPDYVMVLSNLKGEMKWYSPLNKDELSKCTKNGEYVCEFSLFIDISNSHTCIAAILQDNPDLIYNTCEFRFYRNQLRPGFVPFPNPSYCSIILTWLK